jgi:hypothetical protein
MSKWRGGGRLFGNPVFKRETGNTKMWSFRTVEPEMLHLVRQPNGLFRIKSFKTVLSTSRLDYMVNLKMLLAFENWLSRNHKDLAR